MKRSSGKDKQQLELLKLGKLYEDKQDLNAAINCYEKAISIDKNNDILYIHFSRALRKKGRISEAIQAYQKAIQLNPKQSYRVYRSLGDALSQIGNLDAAIDAYELAIKLKPDVAITYSLLAKNQIQQGDIDKAVANYQKAIELDSEPPLWVKKNLTSALRKQSQLKKTNTVSFTAEEELCLKIWNYLNQINLNKFTEANPNDSSNLNTQLASSFFRENSQYQVIKLTSLSDRDRLFLKHNNISLEYLELIQKDSACQQELYLQHFNHDLKITPHSSAQNSDQVRFALEFQQSMVETGYIYTVCPITGEILRSNHSLLFVPGPALGIYRFVSTEVFYLILAKAPFEKQVIYFPRLELIIHLSSRALNAEQVVNKLKGFAVANWQKVLKYTTSNQPRKKLATLGFHTTPSHHVLNELSGIYRLYKSGLLDEIDQFLVGFHEYFGSLEQIFPEIPAEKIVRFSDAEKEKVTEYALENNYFALAARDTFISEELANRIYQLSIQKCTNSFLVELEEAKQHFPLIFITVRTGSNRAWISQIEGLANLIEKLAADYPNLGIIFDGVSRVEKRDTSLTNQGSQEEAWMEKDRAVIAQILDLLPQNSINIYNSIGCMMYESVVWANAADFYIAPFGGGLTKVTLLGKKPGIVHSNHTLLKSRMTKHWYTGLQRENGIAPTYVPSNYIVDIKSDNVQGVSRNGVLYDCYDCDWQGIYGEVKRIMPHINRKIG